MIAENLSYITEQIESSAKSVGKTAKDIMLLAVTKNVGTDECRTLLDLGVKNLGENRVQSFMGKYDVLKDEPSWHIIGHLQTNKVKYITGKVSLIHSVDSVHLAKEINRFSAQTSITTNILLQINVANEESKFGMAENELLPTIYEIEKMKNLHLRGLMTIPPRSTFEGSNRKYFARLYELYCSLSAYKTDNITPQYLSMGMSDDYSDAIKEGSNIVRIGRALYN